MDEMQTDSIDAEYGPILRDGEIIRDAMIALRAFDTAATLRDLLCMARRWTESQKAQKSDKAEGKATV